jgi:hypothetical protein
MRFMLIMIPRVYQPDTPPEAMPGEGFAPPADAVEKMMKFNEKLTKAGALISLDGLHPGSKGARIAFKGGNPGSNRRPVYQGEGDHWPLLDN